MICTRNSHRLKQFKTPVAADSGHMSSGRQRTVAKAQDGSERLGIGLGSEPDSVPGRTRFRVRLRTSGADDRPRGRAAYSAIMDGYALATTY